MNSTFNQNFIAFNSFKGYGNPSNKIWFVGLEEGGDSISKDNIADKVKECYIFPYYITPKEVRITKTQVWDYISKFLITYLNMNKMDWFSYREIMFTEFSSQFFLTELFPLPKKKFKTWANDYGELFGFSSSQKKEYINQVRKSRFPMLYKLWNEKKPGLTICFGKTGWDYFIELFNLNCIDLKNFNNIKIGKNKNVVLIPFLGNGRVSDDIIQKLAIRLKNK